MIYDGYMQQLPEVVDLPTLNIHGSVLTALRLHESSSVKLLKYELSG